MAKGVTVSIEGLREVDAALGQLGKATGRNVMRRVAVARLEPIASKSSFSIELDLGPNRSNAFIQRFSEAILFSHSNTFWLKHASNIECKI